MPPMHLIKRSSNRQNVSAANRSAVQKRKSQTSENDMQKKRSFASGFASSDESAIWCPHVYTALKLFMSLRLAAALWSNISDCDETYNYWEPLHLLLYGSGMQTWEYSPVYAIRSYAYIWLYAFPIKIFQALISSKVTAFFLLRCLVAGFCALVEAFLYKTLADRFSRNVARIWFCFQLLCTGMFVASSSILPSSFAMVLNMIAIGCWLQNQIFLAIFATAVSGLVGWPFAAILGVPIAADVLLRRWEWKTFLNWSVISGLVVCVYLLQVDSYYYGKRVLTPLNIVLYNVFSGHGPNLYGVEPLSYYAYNGLLNLNVVLPLALLSLPLSSLTNFLYFGLNAQHWRDYLPVFFLQLSMWLWLLVFCSQPHKEERFLFPIYPLFCICAAISMDALHRIYVHFLGRRGWSTDFVYNLTGFVLLCFSVVSLSRSFALYNNYHAPFEVFRTLHENPNLSLPAGGKLGVGGNRELITLCIGKEWYRFPSSFFLPNDHWRMQFVRSKFKGILPKPYANLPLPEATREEPTQMNDHNREEPSRYVDISACDFLVDLSDANEQQDASADGVEPDYAQDVERWETIASVPFLIAAKSHRWLRAFYVPQLSNKFNYFGNYTLLRAIRRPKKQANVVT